MTMKFGQKAEDHYMIGLVSSMKISKLIQKLQEAQEKYGDVECLLGDAGYYSWGETDILEDFNIQEVESGELNINVFSLDESGRVKTSVKEITESQFLEIGFTYAVP